MTPDDRRVDDAIQLAIERYGAKMLETVREEIASFRKDFESTYRTCATCDERHKGLPKDMATVSDVDSVDKRVTELRGWIWGLAAATLLTFGGVVVDFLSRK